MTDATTVEPAAAPQDAHKALEPPSHLEGLDARQKAARELVETLRGERTAAALKGVGFDFAALRDAEDEVDAIAAAQAEIARREREKAAKAERSRLRALRRQAHQHDDERRAAIEEAEASARAMAAALTRAEAARGSLQRTLQDLGARVPLELHSESHADRLSDNLSVILTTLAITPGGSGRFGHLTLHTRLFAKPEDAWLSVEEPTRRALNEIMEKVGR